LGPCSECGEEIEFDDYMLGREAECPFCHGVTICDGKIAGGFPTKIVAITAASLLVVSGGVAAVAMKKGGGDEGETQMAQASGDSLPANPFSSSAGGGDGEGSSGGGPAGGDGGGMGMQMGMQMGMSMDMGGSMDMAMDPSMDMAMASTGSGGSGYDAIKGFLVEKCGNCHGAEKQRGDYRLDTLQGAMTAVTPGQATRSPLYTRISLPADHDDIMPPRGGKLSDAQIAAVKAWIDGGAK
jgi:cytochrome c553